MALITHTVSGDSFFAFAKKCLFSETLANTICYIYKLYEPMLITSDKIADAIIERKKNIYSEYGIHGVAETFKIKPTNVFRYKYKVHGRTQWLFHIKSQRGGVSTRISQFTPELFSHRSIRLRQTEKK